MTCGACGKEMQLYGVRHRALKVRVHEECAGAVLQPEFVGRFAHAKALSSRDLQQACISAGIKVTRNGSYKNRSELRHAFALSGSMPRPAAWTPNRSMDMPTAQSDRAVWEREVERLRARLSDEQRISTARYTEMNALAQENARLCGECKALREQNDKLMGRTADPVEPLAVMSKARFAGLEVD